MGNQNSTGVCVCVCACLSYMCLGNEQFTVHVFNQLDCPARLQQTSN